MRLSDGTPPQAEPCIRLIDRFRLLQDGMSRSGLAREDSSELAVRASLLRQPDFAHQLSKPWVGTQGVEQEVSLQT
jgi:hypothetical protein